MHEQLTFTEILPLSVEVNDGALRNCDAFLIGPYSTEPLKQAQRANQRNPSLSIIVFVFQEQFLKVKQAVHLAYNIGKNVTCLPYVAGKDISAVLDNAVLRTRQRKSFAKISAQTTYPMTANKESTFQSLGIFLEHLPLGALILDKDKKIVSANHNARNTFGALLKTGGNTSLEDVFPDVRNIQDVAALAETGEEAPEIIKVNNHFLEINISPVLLEENKPHYILLINDVTSRVKLENELKTKIDDLEFLNQELDQFLSIISHDFKTPITSISVLIELASTESDSEKKQQLINKIKSSGDRLKDTLKGLNAMVDIKNNKAEKTEIVSFEERVAVITGEYLHNLQNIEGKIVTDFSRAPSICYYKAHIDTYLSNLITNAIKYRNTNEPLMITINSRREKEYVVLSIKDNGMGIDLTRNLNKLFQPFRRLTDMGTGSGLGLSIIKRMIERDQGYMEVYSQPGEGTEFIAYLKEPY